jgi:drug/metabolite transporter (DMT)-like permease
MSQTSQPSLNRAIDPFGLAALVGGALAMGISPIFVRFAAADGVPAFASAFWRVVFALPVLYAWALAEERQSGTGTKPSMNNSAAKSALASVLPNAKAAAAAANRARQLDKDDRANASAQER